MYQGILPYQKARSESLKKENSSCRRTN